MKPKNLEKVEQNERKRATEKNKVESTPVGKSNKEETNSDSTPVEKRCKA